MPLMVIMIMRVIVVMDTCNCWRKTTIKIAGRLALQPWLDSRVLCLAVQECAFVWCNGEGGVADPGSPLAGSDRQAVQDGEAGSQQESLCVAVQRELRWGRDGQDWYVVNCDDTLKSNNEWTIYKLVTFVFFVMSLCKISLIFLYFVILEQMSDACS